MPEVATERESRPSQKEEAAPETLTKASTGIVRPAEDSAEHVDLFDFLRVLAVASYRGLMTRKQAALAQLVALDSDGTSGTGVIVRADHVALELGISESQVWRQFGQLRDSGWFHQTARPSRGSKPGQGRRARYRTMCPPLDFGLAALPPASDRVASVGVEVRDVGEGARSNHLARSSAGVRDDQPERLAYSGSEVRDDTAPNVSQDQAAAVRDDRPPTPETSRSSEPERLAVLGETSRTHHAQRCDSPTSDGPTSDGPTTPVVDLGAQPQDARARDPQPELLQPWPDHNGCAHRRRTIDGDCLTCGAVIATDEPETPAEIGQVLTDPPANTPAYDDPDPHAVLAALLAEGPPDDADDWANAHIEPVHEDAAS